MIEIRVRRVLKARPLPTLLENASRNALLIIRSIPPAHMRRALRAISHVSEPQHGRLLRMMRDYCWDIASCPRIAPSLLSSTPAFPAPDTLLFILMFFWIPTFMCLPLCNLLARGGYDVGVWVLFTFSMICGAIGNMAFVCNLLIVNEAAPTRRSLGSINGEYLCE